jgi:predicted dehydrogenase
MKAIIIGGGSIGKRHSKNLNDLGVSTRIVDVDEVSKLKTILSEGFDMGLVCTPNSVHLSNCLDLCEYNIPIFCEKPFYSIINKDADSKLVKKLLFKVKSKNLLTMVGCNLRFTPEIKKINSNATYINVYCGYNLKKWRPTQNHLESYSANKYLGGGILLDSIHELDYLYYKFGKIHDITFTKDKISTITNDTEDLVIGRVYFENTIADFTLNYLNENYQRYYDILEDNSLNRCYFNFTPESLNQMYIDEMKYFINCVKTKTQGMNSFEEAHNLLKKLT